MQQELQDQSEDTPVPLETLRPSIRVFVANNNDPTIRAKLLLFNLRILMSNNARESHKTGALLSMFSLPAAAMRNHIKLAMRSPEANIEIVEINGFEGRTFQIIPDARSTLSRAEVLAYAALAEDMPDTLNRGTPFINADIEDMSYDETEAFLDLCYSVLMQAWIVTCKCMTAPDQPPVSIDKRLAKYQQQGRINPRYILQPEARRLIQNAIRRSMVVRHFLTSELQMAQSKSLFANRYYAMVGDIGKYIEHSGMGGFFLTLKYGLGTRWPTLALAAFSGELAKLKALMIHYQNLGPAARYMALLESPQLMSFAPAEYPLMYSYAMGIGTVLDANMKNYAFGRSYLNPQYFQLGVETARKQQGAVDNRTAEDLGMTPADKAELTATLAKLTLGKHAAGRQPLLDPFAGADGGAAGGAVGGATGFNYSPPVGRRYNDYESDEGGDLDDDYDQDYRESSAARDQDEEPTRRGGSHFDFTVPQREPGMSDEDYQAAMSQYIETVQQHYKEAQEGAEDGGLSEYTSQQDAAGDFDS